MAQLADLLHHLVDERGSDLLVKVGSRPHVRVDGRLQPTEFPQMGPGDIEELVAELLPAAKAEELIDQGEVDVAHSVPGLGRFRVDVYRQRGSLGLAVRRVVPGAPAIEDLHLPAQVAKLADEPHGLIIVTGAAASGRTTTVAGILDHVNASRPAHIVTLEDPIEVLHEDKQSLVSQREVGADTTSVMSGIRRAGRQNADVIYVDEIRDGAVASAVLSEAAAGRLVITTMSTLSAAETVRRFLELFPADQALSARRALAGLLRGVIAQRLLERADGRGRVPAVEILLGTAKIEDAIGAGADEYELGKLVREGEYHGMQTFDQALFQLYKDNLIGVRDALAAASRPEDLRISLQQAGLSNAY